MYDILVELCFWIKSKIYPCSDSFCCNMCSECGLAFNWWDKGLPFLRQGCVPLLHLCMLVVLSCKCKIRTSSERNAAFGTMSMTVQQIQVQKLAFLLSTREDSKHFLTSHFLINPHVGTSFIAMSLITVTTLWNR